MRCFLPQVVTSVLILVFLLPIAAQENSTSVLSGNHLAGLTRKALRGDRAAQTQIGVALAKGDGVPKNDSEAIRWFSQAAAQGDPHGTVRNGWVRPSASGTYGSDYLVRTLVNYGGIWANVQSEVIYYKCALDSTGAAVHSDNVYSLTFPKDDLPSKYAKYFWSVIAVDNSHMISCRVGSGIRL